MTEDECDDDDKRECVIKGESEDDRISVDSGDKTTCTEKSICDC